MVVGAWLCFRNVGADGCVTWAVPLPLPQKYPTLIRQFLGIGLLVVYRCRPSVSVCVCVLLLFCPPLTGHRVPKFRSRR